MVSVKTVSFRQLSPLSLPTNAGRASSAWRDVADSMAVPALVLHQNMGADGGAAVAYVHLKNAELLMRKR